MKFTFENLIDTKTGSPVEFEVEDAKLTPDSQKRLDAISERASQSGRMLREFFTDVCESQK